jgi:hypothetical protein
LKRIAPVFLAALLLVLPAPALAGAELVLNDGQVLKGVDVQRVDGEYELTLESGQTLSLPVELVAEVRLTGDERVPTGLTPAEPERLAGQGPVEDAPTGLRDAGPQQLAGEPVQAPRTSDQLAVFGEPSKFQQGVVDPSWRPQSDWNMDPATQNNFAPSEWQKSIVDESWAPTSAFDSGKDVMADSRSGFQDSIVDNSWTPTDGFSKKKTSFAQTAGVVRPAYGTGAAARPVMASLTTGGAVSVARPRVSICVSCARTVSTSATSGPRYRVFSGLRLTPRAGRSAPQECADEIFDALGDEEATVAVELLDDPRYVVLPITLYEGTASLADTTHRAVFTIDGGVCRLIGGDLRALLGVRFSENLAVARAATAYDTALGDARPVLVTSEDRIDYAFAVSALLDPSVSESDADFVLLSTQDDLKKVGVEDPSTCPLPSKKRKKQTKQVSGKIERPEVVGDPGNEVVTFATWSSAGGRVVLHTVHLSEDGKVSVERETLAEHVGDHHDPALTAAN